MSRIEEYLHRLLTTKARWHGGNKILHVGLSLLFIVSVPLIELEKALFKLKG
ncbi:MAG: hypothetical protein ACREAZ_07075 [Nitrososphaera sp.]